MKNIKKYNDHIKTYQLRYIKQIIFKKYYYSFRIMSGKNKTPKKNTKRKKINIFWMKRKVINLNYLRLKPKLIELKIRKENLMFSN